MYVCICNAVSEGDVRSCVSAGACTTREVRAACGMRPGCGLCTKRLRSVVSESLAAVELAVVSIADDVVSAERAAPVPAQALAAEDETAFDDTRPVEHAA